MFPVFPVCSQFPTHAFNVFPAFTAPAGSSISAVFYIPFLRVRTLGTIGT